MAARKRKTTAKVKEQFVVGISECGNLSQLYVGDPAIHNTLNATKDGAVAEAERLATDCGCEADDSTIYIMKIVATGESQRAFAWK